MLNTILWLIGGHQKRIFQRLGQPVTATQLSRLSGIPADTCSYVLATLSQRKLVRCINPMARRSRLYWLTRLGRAWQRRLRALDGMSPINHDYPDLDWTLYGDVCYSHRAAVIKCLNQPIAGMRSDCFEDRFAICLSRSCQSLKWVSSATFLTG